MFIYYIDHINFSILHLCHIKYILPHTFSSSVYSIYVDHSLASFPYRCNYCSLLILAIFPFQMKSNRMFSICFYILSVTYIIANINCICGSTSVLRFVILPFSNKYLILQIFHIFLSRSVKFKLIVSSLLGVNPTPRDLKKLFLFC